MSAIDRITMNPGVCGGRPCIGGLRIRVKDVLDLLAAGEPKTYARGPSATCRRFPAAKVNRRSRYLTSAESGT
jgi:hypothetical protein